MIYPIQPIREKCILKKPRVRAGHVTYPCAPFFSEDLKSGY
jgi:hypothetical protein